MMNYKHILGAFLFAAFAHLAVAQNNTNSPYTRYGLGQLSDQAFGNSKGMGGIAYGLRDGSQINALNPASYTAVDSLTFLFDGGLSLQNTNFTDGNTKLNAKNSSVDYIAMQFRLRKGLGMTIGLLPYSNIGYNLNAIDQKTDDSDASNVVAYSGDGGFLQTFIGLGANITKNLSVGANVSYLFGSIDRSKSVSIPLISDSYSSTEVDHLEIHDYKLDLGAQYTFNLDKKNKFTLGAVYSFGHTLNNEAYVQRTLTQVVGTSTQTISYEKKDTAATFGIPTTFGLGVTYMYNDKLTVGVDYTMQKWSSVEYMSNGNYYCDRSKIALGAEYVPNKTGRSYLSHIKYRLGGYYATPYYKIKGEKAVREYGLTAGLGLPLFRNRSLLSLSAQYVKMDGLQANLLDENYLKICVGLTFNERWFFKRKVE